MQFIRNIFESVWIWTKMFKKAFIGMVCSTNVQCTLTGSQYKVPGLKLCDAAWVNSTRNTLNSSHTWVWIKILTFHVYKLLCLPLFTTFPFNYQPCMVTQHTVLEAIRHYLLIHSCSSTLKICLAYLLNWTVWLHVWLPMVIDKSLVTCLCYWWECPELGL